MRKLVLAALAAASLTAAGGVLAQDGGAECQAGSAWGPKPGCGSGPAAPHYPYIERPQGAYVIPADPHSRTYPRYAPYAYDGTAKARPARPVQQPHRRDRDGDGVRNNRDRFPDDPYWH